jgi:hypothetical protein
MRDKLARRVVNRFLKKGMEFDTPEALKKYLSEHPNADRSLHTVKKQEKGEAKPAEKKEHEPWFPNTDKLPETIHQKVKEPKELFEQAAKAHEQQLDLLNRSKGLDKMIHAKVFRADKGEKPDYDTPGPLIIIGPMKKQERSKEKVDADYKGDWSRLGDIVRGSVVLDSMDQLEDAVAALRKAGIKLAKPPKDRFAKPTEAGYRDMLVNVEYPNGHVGELQLHLKPIIKAKSAGHKFYEETRAIESKAKKEGREHLTPEEQSTFDAAMKKMKDLYDGAWKQATSRSKEARMVTASETNYFEWDGFPVIWEKPKLPVKTNGSGKKVVIYELWKFVHEATRITKADYDKKVDGLTK